MPTFAEPPERLSDEPIRSHRPRGRIERLYVLLASEPDGSEGVVRRETPAGPQPFITDDPALAEQLCAWVRAHRFPEARIVVFTRSGTRRRS